MDIKQKTFELLSEYRRSPSVEVRNQIVAINIGLARKAAHRLSKDGVESLEDLIQVGTIGLCKAVERFDPSKGNAFSSFAMPYVRGEISHWRRDKSRLVKVPRPWHDKYPRIKKMAASGATIENISAATGLSISDIAQAINAMQFQPYSLDTMLGDGNSLEISGTIQVLSQWEDEIAMHIPRRDDGLIDATEICKRHKKRFSAYWRRRGKQYCQSLKHKQCQSDTLYVLGNGRGNHTYVCDEIALDLLRWCDPSMGAAIDSVVIQKIA